jgi:protein-tyrosine phosphatase
MAAQQRGVDLSKLRARQVSLNDFESYDYILAMDNSNLDILMAQSPAHAKTKINLFMNFAPTRKDHEVPDPYYGGQRGFEIVIDMIEDASTGLLDDIRKRIATE